jgi:sugar lactone lactonase YvrE
MSAKFLPLGFVVLLALSACGGGGSTPAPAPPVPPPPPDSEPDAFTIQPVPDAPRGTAVVSQAVQVRGINTPATVSIAGGEYSVSGGAFTSSASTVANAQSIVVRATAASSPGGEVQATLTIGGVVASFTVTTSTDVTPPSSALVFPTARSRTSSEQLIVRGTASDTESPVASVRVNGVEATSTDNFATWTATVPLVAGANSIVVDAMDRALNRSAATARADVVRNALIGFIEGIAVDTAANRVIASETFAGGLISIDLVSGLRTIIPNTISPLTSMAFDRLVTPSSITLEANGTHALVLDRSGPAAILRVNLATGARTVVSGRGFPNTLNELGNNAMAMSVDLANGRAYVLSRFPDAIYAVDLATGVRTVLSDATTPNGVDMFPNPMTLGIDPARNRLLVGDQGSGNSGFAIYTVALDTGLRDILSSDTVPNANNPLSFVGSFAIDGDRALVTQHQSGSVFAVDLVTNPGNRTIFSSSNVPNGMNAFEQPRVLAIDSVNGRLFVSDTQLRSLFSVDLTTGMRTVVSPNEPDDIGARLLYSTGVALDLGANRLYVTDPLSRSLVAVNLATGYRTPVSSSTVPFGPAWNFPNAVAIDAAYDRFLVADLQGPSVYAVAFDTGARSVLSGPAQSGPAFVWPHTLAVDQANNRALVADGSLNAIVAVNLTDGARTILSGPAMPPGNELTNPYGIALDPAGGRALVTHVGPPSVVAVDLATGARTVLATAGNTGTWLPQGIGIDAATRLIVTGDSLRSMHVVDAVSGNRTLVSSAAIPHAYDRLNTRGVAVDAARRIAWVTNEDFAIPQVVDLVTGERVFLTR